MRLTFRFVSGRPFKSQDVAELSHPQNKDYDMATILLVEDHPMNRKLVRDILQFQFEVDEAISAEAAEEYLRTHRPDLILMDIQLPGMDGLTLTRRLKADPATADIPIVGLSAHAMRRDIEMAHEAGCVDYITKPITDDPFTFLERIAHSLTAAAGPESTSPCS
jgi:CheY-like chemotaxis protein